VFYRLAFFFPDSLCRFTLAQRYGVIKNVLSLHHLVAHRFYSGLRAARMPRIFYQKHR
jgi:hypothetical protein